MKQWTDPFPLRQTGFATLLLKIALLDLYADLFVSNNDFYF